MPPARVFRFCETHTPVRSASVASVSSASRFSWPSKVPDESVHDVPLLVVASSLSSSIFAKRGGQHYALRTISGSSFPGYSPGLFSSFSYIGFSCRLPASSVVLNHFPQEYQAAIWRSFSLKGTGLPLLITHSTYSIASAPICARPPHLDFSIVSQL